MNFRVFDRRSLLLFVICLAVHSRDGLAEPKTPVATSERVRLLVYRDATGQERPVRTAGDWQQRRQQILAAMQRAMGELPSRERLPPLDVQVIEQRLEDTFTRITLTIDSGMNDRIPAFLYLPRNRSETRHAAVLALHQTAKIGKREVDAQGTPDQGYGRELAQRGYVVLAPDYPSFGDYSCDFTDPRFASGSIKGVFNHMRCIDLLESRPEVDAKRIGVIGHSLGGHNAMFVAAFDERPRAVVSSCGWTPFHDYYQGDLKGWASPTYMPRLRSEYALDADRVPFDFYELVAAFAPRPFLSISPLKDNNFDVRGVRKAIPVAGEVYRLLGAEGALEVRYPDCAHGFPDDERQAAYQFLDKRLRPGP